jgi:hypothetical protein
VERSGRELVKYYPSIRMEGLSKTARDISYSCYTSSRDGRTFCGYLQGDSSTHERGVHTEFR